MSICLYAFEYQFVLKIAVPCPALWHASAWGKMKKGSFGHVYIAPGLGTETNFVLVFRPGQWLDFRHTSMDIWTIWTDEGHYVEIFTNILLALEWRSFYVWACQIYQICTNKKKTHTHNPQNTWKQPLCRFVGRLLDMFVGKRMKQNQPLAWDCGSKPCTCAEHVKEKFPRVI